jgi:hypothetical protein
MNSIDLSDAFIVSSSSVSPVIVVLSKKRYNFALRDPPTGNQPTNNHIASKLQDQYT